MKSRISGNSRAGLELSALEFGVLPGLVQIFFSFLWKLCLIPARNFIPQSDEPWRLLFYFFFFGIKCFWFHRLALKRWCVVFPSPCISALSPRWKVQSSHIRLSCILNRLSDEWELHRRVAVWCGGKGAGPVSCNYVTILPGRGIAVLSSHFLWCTGYHRHTYTHTLSLSHPRHPW